MTAKAEPKPGASVRQSGVTIDVRWIMRELLEEGRVTQEDYNVISTTPREKSTSWPTRSVAAS